MLINHKTRISEIIKTDKKSIEVLVSIDKRLSKLRNPVLRKVLARRVTILDVSRITNKRPELFFKKLAEIGFEIEKHAIDYDQDEERVSIDFDSNPKIILDVRPILESGTDPFDEIMNRLDELDDNDVIQIINSFEPIPLINILEKKGYSYQTIRKESGEVHVFLKKGVSTEKPKPTVSKKEIVGFSEAQERFKGKTIELDVRDLEMPMPMVQILNSLEELKEEEALFVHHKKFPQFLIDELEKRNFKLLDKKVDADNTKLIIYKR